LAILFAAVCRAKHKKRRLRQSKPPCQGEEKIPIAEIDF
jgi:hypothetical protein